MGQRAHTKSKELVVALQVSVCEEGEEKRFEHPSGKLKGTQSFQGMQGMDATI